jgi:bifunctional DNA-binding transcriptional regulator/antitoxin component of YhaV-PrlF toxin-antitoxin module
VPQRGGENIVGTSSKSFEFTANVGEHGEVVIPDSLLEDHGLRPGTRVHVRLTDHALSEQLHKRGVTEEEIQRIVALQLESREQVLKFLLSEGALHRPKDSGRRQRSARRR